MQLNEHPDPSRVPPINRMLADVYDQLRTLAAAYAARERYKPAPTSLVHDALLRIGSLASFESRVELFAAVSHAIRHSLVDRARRRHTLKRGNHWRRTPMDPSLLPAPERGPGILDLDEVLSDLAQHDPRSARVVELRFFGGLDLSQTAAVLGVSRKTVVEDWAFARAWLSRRLAAPRGAVP